MREGGWGEGAGGQPRARPLPQPPLPQAGGADSSACRASPLARALLRSAGVRFAAIYAVLLAASAAALAMFLWWATAGLLDRQTDAAIHADAQGLSERWAEGGLPALVVTIEDRLARNVDDDAIYLLVDPMVQRIAGNLEHWPQGASRDRRLVRAADRARRHPLAGAGAEPSTCKAAFTC